jgi:hypothetical protein
VIVAGSGQILGYLQSSFNESSVDDQFRGFVRNSHCFPRLDLLLHRLEILLNAIDPLESTSTRLRCFVCFASTGVKAPVLLESGGPGSSALCSPANKAAAFGFHLLALPPPSKRFSASCSPRPARLVYQRDRTCSRASSFVFSATYLLQDSRIILIYFAPYRFEIFRATIRHRREEVLPA